MNGGKKVMEQKKEEESILEILTGPEMISLFQKRECKTIHKCEK